ncbi:unnamed protein product [Allacma fusca]|uniref:Myb/SANT-like DNA-binding domain-containing protein n=1 Tax=Allacma fusca TaxID=39272 RepID=A0A8J2NI26_9HEXA|nr:unnamed protein product [Allacma fusca]
MSTCHFYMRTGMWEAAASYSGGSNQNLQSQLAAQAQRRAAQRKLQMAKMMGNGGMAAVTMGFQHQRDHGSSSSQNDPMFVASRRARSNNFTLKETFDLLKIWASPEMQWQMKHNFRNFRVWEAISFSMHELGHERTAIQCKNRIQNLTSIFYRIKKSKQDYRSFNFPYYKLIGDVLDGKKNGTSSITPPPGVNLTPNGSFSTNSGSMTISPTSQNASAGFAAHLALVEEYQHLINGNPDIYMTPTGRSSSNNSNSGLNVLSPEVSLSEGNSPIRVENQAARSSNSASTASSSVQKLNVTSSRNGNGVSAGSNSTSAGGCSLIKVEPEDCVTVTVEDSANASELDQENTEDDLEDTEQLLNDTDDCRSDGGVGEGYPSARTKRSFSASFAPYGSLKSGSLGNPAKRPRVGSTSAASASGLMDDPIGQYLAEMVEIERQWLDMERERAENERQMMVYMMQVLQALVCPGQNQEDDENNDENENENENDAMEDGEGQDFQENDQEGDADENEIHEMIANGEETDDPDVERHPDE